MQVICNPNSGYNSPYMWMYGRTEKLSTSSNFLGKQISHFGALHGLPVYFAMFLRRKNQVFVYMDLFFLFYDHTPIQYVHIRNQNYTLLSFIFLHSVTCRYGVYTHSRGKKVVHQQYLIEATWEIKNDAHVYLLVKTSNKVFHLLYTI